jgi:hypothetical protein
MERTGEQNRGGDDSEQAVQKTIPSISLKYMGLEQCNKLPSTSKLGIQKYLVSVLRRDLTGNNSNRYES